MKVHTIDGKEVEITMDEAKRIHGVMSGKPEAEVHKVPAEHYAATTNLIMQAAQKELREATGDYPEDLEELYEFAAKHRLFGGRRDTHILCNFMKLFFCLMQQETHKA